MRIVWILSVLLSVNVVFAGVFPNFATSIDLRKKYDQQDWWETASFYQIYPRSFKDSDADGVGDLKGIRDALPYLKEIGVTATWLSPIFKSPMADFGYDISDYYEVDPIFGTMADFESLTAKAQELGIKIILDFVPNHSSDEHEWFKKSAAKDPEYKDYYVWHPGKTDAQGNRQPPSNWVSVFRGPAWTWNEQRQEYYLHQFLDKQPDFNFRNEVVKEKLRDILRFWLGKGVSGFRVDAVPHCVELAPDANGEYVDEPREDNDITDPDDYGYLKHIYTKDQPETLELVYDWRKVLDDWKTEHGGETKVLLTEAYSDLDTLMKYYGNGDVQGAHIPFNFIALEWLSNSSDAYHYASTLNAWLDKMPTGRRANWVLGNHDKNRIGSRFGTDRMDLINIMIKTLPDVSVTYYGEELGMTDVWISWEDTQDPQACNTNPNVYEGYSRDPVRTPMQWNDEKNGGFSTGSTTWLPVADSYKTVNVKNERGIARSHLNIYKELQQLRTQPTFKYGTYEVKGLSNNVFAIVRRLTDERTYVTVFNIGGEQQTVNLASLLENIPSKLRVELVTEKSSRRKGDEVSSNAVILRPYEATVLATSDSPASKLFNYYVLG